MSLIQIHPQPQFVAQWHDSMALYLRKITAVSFFATVMAAFGMVAPGGMARVWAQEEGVNLERSAVSAAIPLTSAQSSSPQATPLQATPLQATLVQATPPSAEAAQSNLVIGVVQSEANADQWQAIVSRLDAANVRYQVINWETVDQTTPFDGVSIVFLPSVAAISSEQVLALQNWVNRGGGVIASGTTGQESSAGVRRALQSLLGAYWDASLSQPVTLRPIVLNSQRWLREGDTETSVIGGTLIPTGLGSESIATWNSTEDGNGSSNQTTASNTRNAVAMVITRQTIFLGWQWGDTATSSSNFDVSWLSALLSHFQGVSVLAANTPSTNQPRQSTTPPQFNTPPAPAPTPSTSSPHPPANPRPNQSAARPSSPAPLLPPPATFEPDEESAPPGLVVQPGALPISIVEAIAMRQELENLIGRFESALLAAEAVANNSVALEPDESPSGNEVPAANLTASADETTLVLADSSEQTKQEDSNPANSNPPRNSQDSHPNNQILQEARAKLATFSELVRQRNYEEARNQWLEARQLLWEHLPTDRPLAQTEIRAIWLDRGTIVEAGSKAGLAEIFDRLAAAGINTVFFETVNAGYPIYPSEVAPQQNPLTRRWDPLEAAVELAHERGMELHAWVWTFAAGNEAHNDIINLPHSYPGPILSANPDWAGYDNRGNLILAGQEEPFLDPANPAVRRYLLSLYEEIITRYDVDGLQLDYIRYPFQNPNAGRSHGYGIAARQQFQLLTGVDPINISPSSGRSGTNDLWQQWVDFRVEQVNSFVAETADLIDRLRPEVVLSTAVFAMPEEERIRKIQQNWEVWAREGDVDLIVPMTYAADTNRLQQLASPWLTEETADLGAAIVIPGIRILNLSDAMVFDQIQALRDLPSGGYALFATAHLHENLQGILNRTQGVNQEDPIPYREPFAAAADRFNALQREWSFLLSQDQLWIRDREQETWQSETDALQQALNNLAENPSDRNLQAAREKLQAYQTNFEDWMYLQSLTQGYRIRTWQNRLTTIGQLLEYGDRAVLNQDVASE